MIKERYCSREVSELLREKGFDEECYWYYPINGGEIQELTFDELNYHRSQFIKTPTHQMACDWLIDNYKILIIVQFVSENGYNGVMVDIADFDDAGYIAETEYYLHIEQTYNEALKYVLTNLI